MLFYITVTQFHIYRLQREEQDQHLFKYQSISELTSLLPLSAQLPPMAGWIATPELAITILKIIQKYKPKQITELGSGFSIIVAGYSIRKYCPGSAIISLDHDAPYAEKTRQELNLHGLNDLAEVRTAPLQTYEIAGKNWEWYTENQLSFDNPVDLLLVDGPPSETQRNARQPVLPLLYKHLSDRAVIILHDTDRKSETESIQQWIDEFDDLQMERIDTEKGIALLRKRF